MAQKVHLLGAFVLIAVVLFSVATTTQAKHPKHNAFGFINQFQSCHKGQNVTGLHHLKKYLHEFGYLGKNRDHDHDDDIFDDRLESAVKSYQRNFHLGVTGTLDAATVKQMMEPRCGVPDVVNAATKLNRNRKLINSVSRFSFFPGSPRWEKSQLTYGFRSTSSVPGVAFENARSIFSRAFQRWTEASGGRFTFQEVSSGRPDMVIGFHRGHHGDNAPFDGFMGTYAHAFSPPHGMIHFDADEVWSANPGTNQLDLESVAVHEIGHALGLGHEPNIPDAIMFPYFSYGRIKRGLHADDIRGIRTLYRL